MASEDKLAGRVIVLTGASGFLGRNLLSALDGEGARIITVTSKSENELLDLCSLKNKDTLQDVCSPRDRQSISRALRRADFLINCAFPRSSEGAELAMGLEFTSWLFEEAASQGARAVVNISSQSVYSQHRTEPATEETPVCPESSYAVAKYATELMLNTSCKSIPHTSIRLASLIGPGFDQRVVNKMAHKALTDGRVIVLNCESHFGYLDYLDATAGILALVHGHQSQWKTVYNLGPINSVTLEDVAKTIKSCAIERDKKVLLDISNTNEGVINTSLDSSRFYKSFEWIPQISLRKSINRIMNDIHKS